MDKIILLDDFKISSFDLKTVKTDKGTIENTTLDGTRYGIYNYIDYQHELKLEYLTSDELEDIETEFNTYLLANTQVSFSTSWLEKFDFIQHGTRLSNISFMISAKGYKSKQNTQIPGYYDLTLKLTQRVVM